MLVVRDKEEMRAWCRSARAAGRTLGFVPTMGFLHEGHLSLVRTARESGATAVVVRAPTRRRFPASRRAHAAAAPAARQVSIYVNPTQFAPGEDLDVYPRDPEGDHAKLSAEGVDVVFEPRTLYDDTPGAAPHETYVTVEKLQVRQRGARAASRRCGAPRADRATPPAPAGLVRRQPAHALPRRGHRGVQAV